MTAERNCERQPSILATRSLGITLPCNTKYTAGNPIGQLLIRTYLRSLVDLLGAIEFDCALDVGCGEGILIRQVGATWPGVQLTGLDIGHELLAIARNIAPSATYVRGSVYSLPVPDASQDLVLCAEVLEHLTQPISALAELVRATRRYLLISVPFEPWWRVANLARMQYVLHGGNTPGHINHWGERSLLRLLRPYVNILEIRRPPPWLMVLAERKGSRT